MHINALLLATVHKYKCIISRGRTGREFRRVPDPDTRPDPGIAGSGYVTCNSNADDTSSRHCTYEIE